MVLLFQHQQYYEMYQKTNPDRKRILIAMAHDGTEMLRSCLPGSLIQTGVGLSDHLSYVVYMNVSRMGRPEHTH